MLHRVTCSEPPPLVAPPGATCLGCGYSLVALPRGKCPECGRDFDPEIGRTLGPRRHALLEAAANFALPWWITVCLALWGFVLITRYSYPGGWVSDQLVGFWALSTMAAGVLIVLPLLVKCLACPIAWSLRLPGPRRWMKFFAPALILAGVIVCQRTGAVWRLRWMLHRSDFVALSTAPAASTAPCRIGTFYIRTITVLPDSTVVCQLGFPDTDSDQPMELRHGPSAYTLRGPAQVPLTDGWVFWMDPF